MPKFWNAKEHDQLLANGRLRAALGESAWQLDLLPVVKLVNIVTGCVWLLTEIDAHDPSRAVGLWAPRHDVSEHVSFPIALLEARRDTLRLGCLTLSVSLVRDPFFRASMPDSSYHWQSRSLGYLKA